MFSSIKKLKPPPELVPIIVPKAKSSSCSACTSNKVLGVSLITVTCSSLTWILLFKSILNLSLINSVLFNIGVLPEVSTTVPAILFLMFIFLG